MPNFIEIEDYKLVSDDKALDVIHQSDEDNRLQAEKTAIEEISGYLRSRFDTQACFSATGDQRNKHLVMITCDVALYHLIAWMPKRIGFEIRELRYKRAIEWLREVQKGLTSPDLPVITDESGVAASPMRWGSEKKNKYDY